jgi:hypothetical protein
VRGNHSDYRCVTGWATWFSVPGRWRNVVLTLRGRNTIKPRENGLAAAAGVLGDVRDSDAKWVKGDNQKVHRFVDKTVMSHQQW